MDEQTERIVAEGLRRGDSSAMQLFYESYSGLLFSICSRYIPDNDDACDVLQESLVKIFSKAGKFKYRGKGSLSAWASRIVVNEALSNLKGKKYVSIGDEGDIQQDDGEDDLSPDIPPEELFRMIRSLPDGYRTVFNMYVFEDMTHKEIARELGIREDSSASQLLRARKLLRKEISKYRKENDGKLEERFS